MKPSAKRQRESRERRSEQGMKRLDIWIYKEDEKAIRDFVKRLNESKENIDSDRSQ